MERLSEVADLMLQMIRNKSSDHLNELFLKAFAQQIKHFATSQGECTAAFMELKG